MAPPFGSDWRSLEAWLAEKAGACDVPGASLALFAQGRAASVAVGYANAPEQIEATPDTLFQIGSVTKSLTATLVMQLVEEGVVDLDAPIGRYLKTWRSAEPERDRRVRIRHLLSHTSGLDGDWFEDTGRGEDAIERLLELGPRIGYLHAPAERFSYCNFGYQLLGRLLEIQYGASWDGVLANQLVAPLGLGHSVVLPEALIRHRVALGHGLDGEGRPSLAPLWARSNAASGSRLAMTMADLVAFGRLHLNDGMASTGERILSPTAAQAMRRREVETPLSYRYGAWGLGWMLYDWDGRAVYGHDGGVSGTSTVLRIFPDAGAVLAFSSNGGKAAAFSRAVLTEMAQALAGIRRITTPPPPDPDIRPDKARFIGRYERHGLTAEVVERDGRLVATVGGEYDQQPNVYDLLVNGVDSVLACSDDEKAPVYFCGDGPKADFVYFYERAFRRVG